MSKAKTLGEVCIAIVDCEHKTAPIDQFGDYFAVGTPAMRGDVIDYSEARRVSKETFDIWTRRLLPRHGDLLFAREAPVGPIVQIPVEENVAPGQRTVLLRPDPDQVNSRFLYYLLGSPFERRRLQERASGSTVAHLNVSDVRDFQLPLLPSLPDQAVICEFLGALDDKISANQKLEETAVAYLALQFEMIGVDSEIGQYATQRLDELFDLNPSYRVGSSEPVYLEMQKLPTSGMTIADWGRREAKGGVRFMNGDTLMARITPCLENRKTGFVDFLADDEVGIGSTEYIALRSKPGVPREMSYFLAVSPRFRAFAIKHMVGTSGRQRLSANDLASYELRVVDQGDLDEWGAIADPLTKRLGSARDETRSLIAIRDALLPQLMSGKLRVRDAEKRVEAVL